MAYTPDMPPPAESADQLRARIPGWGVDLDPSDRPSVPKLQRQEDMTGAHWEFPDRQPEVLPRERSVEHKFLTPVFGTSCPPKALSGVLRKWSYRRFGEDRAAHWLILLGADRVDAWESHLRSLATLRPDNPLTETGVWSEFSRHGIASRLHQNRADLAHQTLDPFIVAGPWVAAATAAWLGIRTVLRGRRA
jgi:hypothetical protein